MVKKGKMNRKQSNWIFDELFQLTREKHKLYKLLKSWPVRSNKQ